MSLSFGGDPISVSPFQAKGLTFGSGSEPAARYSADQTLLSRLSLGRSYGGNTQAVGSGVFYPDQILRDAAKNGEINTASVDGNATWLNQLPALGSAILRTVGAQPEPNPRPAGVQDASFFGGRGGGVSPTMIAGLAAGAAGIWFLARG